LLVHIHVQKHKVKGKQEHPLVRLDMLKDQQEGSVSRQLGTQEPRPIYCKDIYV